MAISGVRLFYLFLNEDEILKNLLSVSKNQGLSLTYIIGGEEAKQPLLSDSARLAAIDNMLLLSLLWTGKDLSAVGQERDALEKAGLLAEGFLGKVTLVVYDGGDWQQLIETAENTWQRRAVFNVETPELSLARLGWLWPDQETIYIARAPQPNITLTSFFDLGLAQVEAATLKLHTISELYISQSKYVSEEKNQLDRALSELLNQQTRIDAVSEELPDIWEKSLNQLSTAYMVLSGYYRVIRDAHTRTVSLVSSLRRRLVRDPVLSDQQGIGALFLDYYGKRLTSLEETQKDLQDSLNDHQAAIEMMQGRIDIMNSRENLRLQHQLGTVMELNTSLQEQSLTFQIAASLIEFIILAYYSLSLFKYLAPDAYHHIPSGLLFLLFALFAGEAVAATHVIAERILGKHHNNKGAVVVSCLLAFTLGAIFYLAAYF